MDIEAKRNAAWTLHLSQKSNQQIVREMYSFSFASRIMKRYKEIGYVRKCYFGGIKPTETSTQNVLKVKKRLNETHFEVEVK